MPRFFAVLGVLVGFAFGFSRPAEAADYFQFGKATYADGTSSYVDAGCGVQYSVRCTDGGAIYRFCDLFQEPTCTATKNDMVLAQDRTYDIRTPSCGSDNANGRIALLSEQWSDGGVAQCRFYLVRPATLPSEVQ